MNKQPAQISKFCKCGNEIREEQVICGECYRKINNLKLISPNEIVLDCDLRESGDLGIRRIGMVMSYAGYRIELYKAEGQKSYHGHIKDIPHIAELPKKQNEKYKELVLKKYILEVRKFVDSPELDKIDFSLCQYQHPVAEENKPHFKYKTIKQLVAVINEGLQNFCEKELLEQARQEQEYKPKVQGSGITAEIIRSVSIVKLANEYGLSVNKNKCFCPFHDDITGGTPSCVFYESQGRFYCFSCLAQGNIIDFLALLKLNGYKKQNG